MRKVYNFGTGEPIPQEAIRYLTTVVEETILGRFVWHYFLVSVKE